jgi:hypothetical protein
MFRLSQVAYLSVAEQIVRIQTRSARSPRILDESTNKQRHVETEWYSRILREGCLSLRIRKLLQYTPLMGSRASRIAVTLALLSCLICPLVEMFDTWDHTIQTGNDTEYALVVLALCVGVAYSFARFLFKFVLVGFFAESLLPACVQKTFFAWPSTFALPLIDPTSSPPLPLRI